MSVLYLSNPLFVDLDGALITTGLLAVSFTDLFKRHHPLQAPFWLLRSKAYLKHRIAERIALNPQVLPYHAGLLDYLKRQRESGRAAYLAAASNIRYAQAVAGHLAIFEGVLAGDAERNLSGAHKLEAIQAHSVRRRGGDRGGAIGLDPGVIAHLWRFYFPRAIRFLSNRLRIDTCHSRKLQI